MKVTVKNVQKLNEGSQLTFLLVMSCPITQIPTLKLRFPIY